MNWKITFLGGLTFYITTFILGMFIAGPLIHEGVLVELYAANSSFWRPALNQQSPDIAALLPLWIGTGLLMSFVYAGIYSIVRGSLPACKLDVTRGMAFAAILILIQGVNMASWFGIFNLPADIWLWWFAEIFINTLIGCILMAVVAKKLVPDS